MLEDRLSADEFRNALLLDIVVSGQPHGMKGEKLWLAVVSSVIDEEDVTRTRRRAGLLRKAGYPSVPVVAGKFTLG